MINFLFNFRKRKINISALIKYSIFGLFIFLTLWIVNENIAFFGTHNIKISNFLHFPNSVVLSPGYEVGVFDSKEGWIARPFGNRAEFQVTLPRGFNSMDMKAEVQMDTSGTLIMGANSAGLDSESIFVNNPKILEDGWNSISVEGGKLMTKDSSINTAEDFFNNFFKFKKIVGIGPSPESLVLLPKTLAKLGLISLAIPLRSSFSLNIYLDSSTKYLKFIKQDLNYQEGPDNLTVVIRKGNKKIASKTVPDDEESYTGRNKPQDVFIKLKDLQPGFYDISFKPNNEDSVVRNLEIFGVEPRLSSNLFLGPALKSMVLFTTCQKVEIEAVKNSGFQEFVFDGKTVNLNSAKKPISLKAAGNQPVNKLEWRKGDISINSACGFYLQEREPFRQEYNKYLDKVDITTQLDSQNIKKVDAIINTFYEVKAKDKFLILEHTFDLKDLFAKGKTFTFYLESPGLSTRDGGYLYIKKVEFTAKRPAFSLSDIPKAFKAIFK